MAPKIKAHREPNNTWTATLYIEGRWYARMTGFASASSARAAIRKEYIG